MNPAASRGGTETFVAPERFLECVHCGLCLSACPTYLETGLEMDSPRGRIHLLRAVQEGRVGVSPPVVRHLDLCLGCRACEAACPSGVRYGEMLEHGREFIERRRRQGWWERAIRRWFIGWVLPSPGRLKMALMPAHLLQLLGLDGLLGRTRLLRPLAFLPNLSKLDFRPLPAVTPAVGPRRARVGFLSGCVSSVLFAHVNQASVRLLSRAGCEVVVPRGQVCCGALHAHGGFLDKARECARHNVEVFEREDVDWIITNAAGCGSTLKEYGRLLREDPRYAERAAGFSARVRDFSEYLDAVGAPMLSKTPSATLRVTFHDACHLAHAQGIRAGPRRLLASLPGVELVELPEADVCCGSAGSYNLMEPQMADRLQARKVAHLQQTGATVVVTTNPGCILQIEAGLRRRRSAMRVLHLAEFLDEYGFLAESHAPP